MGMESEKSFESYLHGVRHDAQVADVETSQEHIDRLLSEVEEDLHRGFYASSDKDGAFAKLDVVLEWAQKQLNAGIMARARRLRDDIHERYPGDR